MSWTIVLKKRESIRECFPANRKLSTLLLRCALRKKAGRQLAGRQWELVDCSRHVRIPASEVRAEAQSEPQPEDVRPHQGKECHPSAASNLPMCTRKRLFLVSKKFRRNQGLRNRGAVHPDEWLGGARLAMQGAGYQFLSRIGLSKNEDRRIRRGHLCHLLQCFNTLSTLLHQRDSALADLLEHHFKATKLLRA